MKTRLLITFYVSLAVLLGFVLGARVFYNPQPVHAQGVFKIDSGFLGTNEQGQLVAAHVKGVVTLPAGSTILYTGSSLSAALAALEDDTYNTKASTQQSERFDEFMVNGLLASLKLLRRDGPEPIPLCYPWPCKSSE